MIVVDSSVWIDYFNARPTAETDLLESLLVTRRLLVGDLIIVEVLQGFRAERDFGRAQAAFEDLEYASMVGRDIALASARNYRILRARGVTIRSTIDVLIATFCIEEGHALLHSDRDFDPFERHLGLRVVKS